MNKRGLEAKENWIAARIDELLDDAEFAEHFEWRGIVSLREFAKKTAEDEYASLMTDLEEAIIDSMELK